VAYRPNPDGTVSIVDDFSGMELAAVPPETLGSLYNPGAVAAPPPMTDERTAQLTPAQQMIQSRVDAAPAPNAHVPGPQAPPPQPQRKLVGPDASPLPVPGAPQAQPATAQSGLPASGTEASPTADAVRGLLLNAMRPRAGVAVNKPERDVLKNFVVQEAPKQSEETKLAQDLAAVREQKAAAEGGMLRQAATEDIGAAYEQRRRDAQVEISGIRDQERQRDQIVGARMREIDMLGEELRSKRKDATNPNGYWEDKGAFAEILANIGMALYRGGAALAGYDPEGLANTIQKKIDNYNQAKRLEVELVGQEIDEKRTQLGDVRKQFLSRDAADAATRALMNEAVVAETASLAEHYKGADAQATAQQLVAALQARAADARAQAELAERDAVTKNWQHLEAQRGVVGGSAGGVDAALKYAVKVLNMDPLDAIRAIQEGKLALTDEQLKVAGLNKPTGRAAADLRKHAMERQILLPDGRMVYSNSPDKAKKSEETLRALDRLSGNIDRIGALAREKAAGRWSPELESQLRTLVSDNRYNVKEAIAKEALTTGEKENFDPLAGDDIGRIVNWVSDEAQLGELQGILKKRINSEMGALYEDPEASKRLTDPVKSEAEKK
jgi:hypothetical protein